MTLEKAIIHAEAVAKTKEREAKENRNHGGWVYDDEAKNVLPVPLNTDSLRNG